ncbi:MAG: hypothetical protein ACHQF0_16995 [Chitinophagales bacterium]
MEKYAVAINDTDDLFLFLEIHRTDKWDVYVNFNEHHSGHKPHSSYHASGQLHHKSDGHKMFPVRSYQEPKNDFKGSESIIVTSLRKGDGRAWNVKCNSKNYTGAMIIPDEIITPEFGFQLNVEVVEAEQKSWLSTYPYAKIIQQQIFYDNNPWIVVSLYEMFGTLVSD